MVDARLKNGEREKNAAFYIYISRHQKTDELIFISILFVYKKNLI
jgi:hypothetical protein